MATRGQLKSANKFVQQIQKESGPINKFDLMDKLSMSISTYNQLKPYIEHRFGHYVEYNRKNQSWFQKEVIDITETSKSLLEK